MVSEKHDNVGVCDFAGVPAGTYAVTVLDDTNMNGKMDFNLIGMPTKGYGFSKDAKATLSPPSFSAASFSYSGQGSLDVPINIGLPLTLSSVWRSRLFPWAFPAGYRPSTYAAPTRAWRR